MRGPTARSLLSVLVLGAALTASARLWRRPRAPRSEPVRLPYDLQSVSESTVAPDSPPEATWSYLAKTLCGGEDIYSDLMNAAERGLEQGGLFRKKLPPLLSSAEVKRSLACGRSLAAVFPQNVVEHSFAFGNPTRWLYWLARPRQLPESTLAQLPPRKIVASLALVRCASESACSAQVPDSSQWLSGSLEDLRAFSAALPDSPEPTAAQRKLLAALDDDKASSVHASSDKDALMTGLEGRLRFDPMPDTSSKPERIALADALDKHLELWSLATKESLLRFELVGHDERAALQLEGALTAYVELIQKSPQVRRPYLQNASTQWRVPALYQAAENRARARAWREAKIERDGKRVTLVAEAAVSDDRAAQPYEAWHKNRAADAARIVRSLADGNAPGETELLAIGGQYLLQLVRGASGEPPESPYTAPARKLQPPASGDFYSLSDLEALGVEVKALDAQRTLLCGGGAQGRCVCLESLECDRAHGCLSFDENIAAFERALAGKNPGRTVFCEVAEVGRCGDFSYFDFRGDIHRHEMRWFNRSGRLIAQRNWTDYPAYCDGRSNARWLGTIPYCSPISRDRILCGAPSRDKQPPIDDLMESLGL